MYNKDNKIFDAIPSELKELNQWVLWKLETRNGKKTKIPYTPTGKPASSTDPKTWCDYNTASHVAGEFDGIGFVFTESDGITGIDIDCIKDKDGKAISNIIEGGQIVNSEVKKIVDKFSSYTEITQSGNGIHIIVFGNKPGAKCKKALKDKGFEMEIYSHSRFFVMTGQAINNNSIQEKQTELNKLHEEVFGSNGQTKQHKINHNSKVNVDTILYKLRNHKQAAKIEQMLNGGLAGHPSESERDQSLCNYIAYYTKDANIINQIIKSHPVYRPKWDTKHYSDGTTYGQATIQKAIQDVKNTNPVTKTNNTDLPYIRVGVDYFKIIKKPDAFGFIRKELKRWSKEELKDDHGRNAPSKIKKYDDFILHFDYKNHKSELNGCYNLAQPMIHTPSKGDFPWTKELMKHVFGEQLEIGYKYLKLLYQHPHHIAPILAVVSKERGTGKTTLIQWLSMIFGGNCVILGNQDLQNNFNSTYADKHLIFIEETLIEKTVSIEKLKSLATAKQITVNKKFVSQYTLPFYGKIIITSNNEDKFIKVDEEEVRFFVRKLEKPKYNNPNILEDLKKEIPAFLHYLTEMDPLDFSKDRAVFTPEELYNENLEQLKHESKTNLYKNLEERFTDFFLNEGDDKEVIYCSVSDIKHEWFLYNHNIDETYIHHVLKKEFNKKSELRKYSPFGRERMEESKKTGRVYEFKKKDFIKNEYDTPF